MRGITTRRVVARVHHNATGWVYTGSKLKDQPMRVPNIEATIVVTTNAEHAVAGAELTRRPQPTVSRRADIYFCKESIYNARRKSRQTLPCREAIERFPHVSVTSITRLKAYFLVF